MSLIKTSKEIDAWLAKAGRKDKTLGFIPTMGYLHEGHLSLIKKAKEQNDLAAVSIFVNPTQFSPNEDYESYPRDVDRDYRLAIEAGADIVFAPEVNEIYLPDFSTTVEVGGNITKKLCGTSRPAHFKGVTTVVNILFNIIRPDRAYFGQKDAQQVQVIKKMVKDLHIPVEIISCPIVREKGGLALSSRNVYLNPLERKQALSLNYSLQKAEEYFHSGAADSRNTEILIETIKNIIQNQELAVIDYVQILDAENLEDIKYISPGRNALAAVAVKFGKTRLIDNRVLSG